MTATIAYACLIGLLGGLVRGTTGFGAAMVMTPLLALLLGGSTAVPLSLMLEAFAAATMLRAAWLIARWRVIAPICVAAACTVPIGGYLLRAASAGTLRAAIAITVIVFSLAMLSGYRYHGPQRVSTSMALGALSGTMLGATSIGAPPVILYLLSGSDPIAVTRANLTLYVVAISIFGLTMLAASDMITSTVLHLTAWLFPCFVIGVTAGSKLFARFSDQRFRQFTIVFMLLVAIWVLVA
ncbi:MAG: sulfite exporter TauE/SafE family protein [Proteobacteria bacterium]|nr:sulfite exporter TauE/SafE family protein [Pseudomonadota bacterium]